MNAVVDRLEEDIIYKFEKKTYKKLSVLNKLFRLADLLIESCELGAVNPTS